MISARPIELGFRLLAKPATVSFEMLLPPIGGMLHAIEVKLPVDQSGVEPPHSKKCRFRLSRAICWHRL